MTNKPLHLKSQSTRYSGIAVESAAKQELLRQARWEFNLHFTVLAVSLLISTTGGILLLAGKTTEGAATASAGLVSSTFCAQLGRETQEKLERLTPDQNSDRTSS